MRFDCLEYLVRVWYRVDFFSRFLCIFNVCDCSESNWDNHLLNYLFWRGRVSNGFFELELLRHYAHAPFILVINTKRLNYSLAVFLPAHLVPSAYHLRYANEAADHVARHVGEQRSPTEDVHGRVVILLMLLMSIVPHIVR